VKGKAREDSDVDIWVEFERPIEFFKFLELEEYLGKLMGRRVHLYVRKHLNHILKKIRD